MKFNRIAFFAMLFSILCLGGFKAWADDDEIETYGQPESHDFVKHRAYIGIYGTSADVDNQGDFNGFEGSELIPGAGATSTDVNFIPTISRNFGFAGVAGYRDGPWAAEVSYWYSNHSAYLFDGVDANNNPVTALSTTAVYSTINIDLRRYFFTTVPVQPFILAGMNFSFLSSHNTSELVDIATNTVIWSGDQTESGFGLNLGLGLELYLGDGFSVEGGAVQRFTSWGQANGAAKVDENTLFTGLSTEQGNLEGNGINFFIGSTVGME